MMQGSDLLRTFETELHRGTEQLQSLLLEIERINEFSEATPHLQESYRIVHSIKGASRIVGLTGIEDMAHAMEDRFQKFLKEKIIPSAEETSVFLKFAEGFVAAFQSFLSGSLFDHEPLLMELAQVVSSQKDKAGKPEKLEKVVEKTEPEKKTTLKPVEPRAPAPVAAPQPVPAIVEEPRAAISQREEYLNVPTRRFDELIRRVEEAFLIESRIAALISDYDATCQEGDNGNLQMLWQKKHPQIEKESARLHFVLMQFHDLVRQFRMVPISRIRVPLQRAVRDLSLAVKKSASFTLTGEDQMVDASLLDALQEPIIHIIRNSIDHGIEPPEERAAVGKRTEGHLHFEARLISGFLQLQITDDGGGINVEAVKQRAYERGLVSAEQVETWTEPQWIEVIFSPGFSTAKSVSSISGRGMGMDIVKQRIQEMGGYVHVTTNRGVGTTVQLQVPIGLLTPRVLLTRCGPHLAAIPTADIEKVFPLRHGRPESVNGQTLVRLNDIPIPLEPLAAHLGWGSYSTTSGHVIALNRQGTCKGLLVDEIIGEIEQVAFPPPWNLRGIPFLAGVIVLGNGTLVPMIETRDLLRSPAEATAALPQIGAPRMEPISKLPTVLVVDDSSTVLALHRSILRNAGYDVLTAEDGMAGWTLLQSQQPDLILTDIEMPRMNGLELIQKIRGNQNLKSVPIIVISQYGSRDDLQRAAELGADRYIVKSAFDPQKLLEMIRELLE